MTTAYKIVDIIFINFAHLFIYLFLNIFNGIYQFSPCDTILNILKEIKKSEFKKLEIQKI